MTRNDPNYSQRREQIKSLKNQLKESKRELKAFQECMRLERLSFTFVTLSKNNDMMHKGKTIADRIDMLEHVIAAGKRGKCMVMARLQWQPKR